MNINSFSFHVGLHAYFSPALCLSGVDGLGTIEVGFFKAMETGSDH